MGTSRSCRGAVRRSFVHAAGPARPNLARGRPRPVAATLRLPPLRPAHLRRFLVTVHIRRRFTQPRSLSANQRSSARSRSDRPSPSPQHVSSYPRPHQNAAASRSSFFVHRAHRVTPRRLRSADTSTSKKAGACHCPAPGHKKHRPVTRSSATTMSLSIQVCAPTWTHVKIATLLRLVLSAPVQSSS